MAKIKPARGKKSAKGPKNPQAVGCLILIAVVVFTVGLVLFYAMSTK
jgi:hypothetical protein